MKSKQGRKSTDFDEGKGHYFETAFEALIIFKMAVTPGERKLNLSSNIMGSHDLKMIKDENKIGEGDNYNWATVSKDSKS